ncbi:MAG TPA: SgcJ/EcaC family oxidoreductase [Candidatus Eisenbacteria bacterium]|nr:SgcJ/EcaC family oxidoreductase [Candidatus Eisenbacteria bacterium]
MTFERTLPCRRPLLASAATACLVAMILIGCAPERKESLADVRAAIDAVNGQFEDAFSRGDAARISTLYAEDAQIYPPGNPPVSGRVEIERTWRGVLALPVKEMRLETAEVQAFGDDATEVGRYTLIANDGRELDAGKYIVLWKRGAGGWKIHRDIWNSDAPLVTAPPVAPPDSLP